MNAADDPRLPKRFVFVSGCPRSGTTVMATLLNWHDAAFIAQERYATLLSSTPDRFAPGLFRADRLRRFNPGDCGYDSFEGMKEYSAHYANPKDFAALDGYPVRGDKITHLYEDVARLDAPDWAGADIAVVHMVRNAVDVACSYETRKNDASDGWTQGYEAAIRDWTRAVRSMHDYILADGGRARVAVVSYESMFSGGRAALEAAVARVYAFVGLGPPGEKQRLGVEKIHKASEFFRGRRQRHPHVLDDIERRLPKDTLRQYEFLLQRSL